jgi:hypothetical protein
MLPALVGLSVGGRLMQQDYYSVLSSVVMASARDNPRLRGTIYELARSKLRGQIDREAEKSGKSDGEQRLQALETAIRQIEADLAGNVSRVTYSGANIFAPVADSAVEIIPPDRHSPAPLDLQYEPTATQLAAPPPSSAIRSALPLAVAAILGVAAYVAVERGVYKASEPAVPAEQAVERDGLPVNPPRMPLPTGYGIYAINDGKLTELDLLPVKIPERSVAISSTLSTASTAKLPNGQTQFIAFRRDLAHNAPDKVTVRAIAKVMRPSMLGRKEEETDRVGDTWVIRGISYELKVAPVDGNSAMIVIRPADNDFSFPAGRYALVLKGAAYDFTVDGPITDSAQCVEYSEELNAPVYRQCRRP